MKVKVSEAKGQVLNYLVAKAMGKTIYPSKSGRWMTANYGDFNHRHGAPWFEPTTSWAQGGPIIKRERINLSAYQLDENGNENEGWQAWPNYGMSDWYMTGPTPLIAAMRCYVASKLGDEVEVSNELA